MRDVTKRFEKRIKLGEGSKLIIESLENKRIYNPSAPFQINGEGLYLFCRVDDIRIVQLKDRFGVFTRPQGEKFLKGRTCYLGIENIEYLKNEEIYLKAELVDLFLNENEWVGTNDVYFLDENNLGVLGHFAFQKDVVFPGGLLKTEDNNYILCCGLSDEEIGVLKIKNPFE